MSTTPPSVNSSDPTVQRQIERENSTILGRSLTAAPSVSRSEVVYPSSTTSTSADAVTITTSTNNDSGDVTTVYSTNGQITVNSVNQNINQYTSVDSGVSQILAGDGITITSTTGNGTGTVTISSNASPNLGNIVTVNLDGNISNVLHGDGSWSADVTDYGNSNVASFLPTYTGNINADVFSGNATGLANIPGANVTGTVANSTYAISAGTVTAEAQPNITSVGVLRDLISAGNIIAPYFLGNVIGNVSGANVTGTVANAAYANSAGTAATVTTNSQPNITSVGTLSSLSVDGNVSADYFVGVATNVAVTAVNNNYSYHMAFVAGAGDTTLHLDSDDNLQYNPADGLMTINRVDTGYLSVSESVLTNLNPLSNVTQDLGNATHRWKDIYLSNSTIYLGNAELTSNGNGVVVSSLEITDGNIGTIGNIAALNLDGNVSNVLVGDGTFVTLPTINANTVVWTAAPVSNTSSGAPGQVAYDAGGNLFVCVASDTWAKFAGTTSW